MKKIIILLLFPTAISFGQEAPSTATNLATSTTTDLKSDKSKIFGRKNELKIDVIYLIFRPALNLSYERLLSDESAVGTTLMVTGSRDQAPRNDFSNTLFSFTPYFRYYFGKKPAAGFFFEGFAALNTSEYYSNTSVSYYDSNGNYFSNDKYESKKITDLAIGIGLGGKWITNNVIIFELSSGVGRNLLNRYGNNTGINSINQLFGRGGLSVGYRF